MRHPHAQSVRICPDMGDLMDPAAARQSHHEVPAQSRSDQSRGTKVGEQVSLLSASAGNRPAPSSRR
jgi:hypothetical protein